jgi:hypothetical protein
MKDYTEDELIDIVCDDNSEFEIIKESDGSYYKGASTYNVIVKEKSTDKLYRIFYTSTEDSGIIDISQPEEVKQIEKTIIEYEEV